MNKPLMLEYDGRVWALQELASAHGIGRTALYHRIRRGLSVDEAIAMGAAAKGKRYCYHGQMLMVPEVSRISGTAVETIRNRMHRGWSIEEAADLPRGANVRKRVKATPTASDSSDRMRAALKIFSQIGADPSEWNFRCVVPMLEYAFESDLLAWTIRFSPDGSHAELTARYKTHGFKSDLCRNYIFSGDEVQEVLQDD